MGLIETLTVRPSLEPCPPSCWWLESFLKGSGVALLQIFLLSLNPLRPMLGGSVFELQCFDFHCLDFQLRTHRPRSFAQYRGVLCRSPHGYFAFLTLLRVSGCYQKKCSTVRPQPLARLQRWQLICTHDYKSTASMVCAEKRCLSRTRYLPLAPSVAQRF
jgi:hypothetical protein